MDTDIKMDGSLFLIGFMGTGKSTVSRRLSELLGREQAEMDERIVQRRGMAITEIFARYGEAYFRDLESEMVRELGQKGRMVISCGGGVVVREENVANMKAAGKIILLTASPETVYQRVRGSKERPILNQDMSVAHISRLMEQRRALYAAAADLTVATDGKEVEQICAEILEQLNR